MTQTETLDDGTFVIMRMSLSPIEYLTDRKNLRDNFGIRLSMSRNNEEDNNYWASATTLGGLKNWRVEFHPSQIDKIILAKLTWPEHH